MKRSQLLVMLCLLLIPAGARADEDSKLVPSISVVGAAEVQVTPNMAEVTLGVVTEAETAGAALQDNNQKMTQLLATLRTNNIADKHIQTSNFQIAPKQVFDNKGQQPPKIVGYTVTNNVNVKVMEVARLGAILDAVVQSGSNRIYGISFAVAEPGPHLDQARRNAMADAKRRAQLYAKEAGVNVGETLLISEQSAAVPMPKFAYGARAAVAEAAVPISQGEQTISAQVNVTYRIGK